MTYVCLVSIKCTFVCTKQDSIINLIVADRLNILCKYNAVRETQSLLVQYAHDVAAYLHTCRLAYWVYQTGNLVTK